MPSLHGGGILLCMGGALGDGRRLSQNHGNAPVDSGSNKVTGSNQARRLRRFSPPVGMPGKWGAAGRAAGENELVVGYNSEPPHLEAYQYPILCPAMVARRSFSLHLCGSRQRELHPPGIERGGSGRAVHAEGLTAKRKSALLFSVEKIKWARAIEPRDKRPHIGNYAHRDPTFAMQSKPII